MAILSWRNPDYYDKFGKPKPEMKELYSQDEVLKKKQDSKPLRATLFEFDKKNQEP